MSVVNEKKLHVTMDRVDRLARENLELKRELRRHARALRDAASRISRLESMVKR